jgi:hypothetical protein
MKRSLTDAMPAFIPSPLSGSPSRSYSRMSSTCTVSGAIARARKKRFGSFGERRLTWP